jgi:hypothetical protein
MSAYAIRAVEDDDDEGIRCLLGAPQPSALLSLGFERSPSYLQAAQVSHIHPDILVAQHKDSADIVAVVNLGRRPVYINGECQDVRFAGDLRVAAAHQGGRLLVYLSRRMREIMGNDGWYQTIILNENERSRSALAQGGRAGMPFYEPQANVETYTLTGARSSTPAVDCAVRTATLNDIPAMNNFVRKMAAYYQFLPAYDFTGLVTADPYFQGLSIDDFILVERHDELVGLGAVWNQKGFKQTRVVSYQPWVRLARPLINAWAGLFGGLYLPPEGELLDYQLIHSPLTAPTDSATFAVLLNALWQRCQQKGGRALSLSLSANDPRRDVIKKFRHFFMAGTHYLASFSQGNFPEIDEKRVPYFECGRL